MRKVAKSAAKKVKAPTSPSAYILFSKKERAHLMATDAVFQSLKTTEKLGALGAKWKELSDAQKEPFVKEAASLKEQLSLSTPAPAEAEDVGPFVVSFKNQDAVDALAKKIADEAVKAFIKDLVMQADGGAVELAVPGGKFKSMALIKPEKKSPAIGMQFQPAASLRKE